METHRMADMEHSKCSKPAISIHMPPAARRLSMYRVASQPSPLALRCPHGVLRCRRAVRTRPPRPPSSRRTRSTISALPANSCARGRSACHGVHEACRNRRHGHVRSVPEPPLVRPRCARRKRRTRGAPSCCCTWLMPTPSARRLTMSSCGTRCARTRCSFDFGPRAVSTTASATCSLVVFQVREGGADGRGRAMFRKTDLRQNVEKSQIWAT